MLVSLLTIDLVVGWNSSMEWKVHSYKRIWRGMNVTNFVIGKQGLEEVAYIILYAYILL